MRIVKDTHAEFEVLCNGSGKSDGWEMTAGTSGPREEAWKEALAYAAVDSADGPVRIFEVTRTLVTTLRKRKTKTKV